MAGLAAVATAALAVELTAPLLLLCWLCCWPDDSDGDDTSSAGKPPKKPVVANTLRRGFRSPPRRLGSSAASLHLPGTSGHKQPLSAHRSHEEIPRRRRSNLDPEDDTRYHSAPSVIDEVIHRRDWERSTKDLYIPLRSEVELLEFGALDDDNDSLEAPRAEPESTSIVSFNRSLEKITLTCKKHHTNIKSSKNRTKKEAGVNEVKDTDATETGSQLFIGQSGIQITEQKEVIDVDEKRENTQLESSEEKMKSVYKAKEAKQTFNESIKAKEHSHNSEIHADIARLASSETRPLAWCHVKYLEPDLEDATDRSGAMHDSLESRCSLPFVTTPLPPNSTADSADYPAGYAADSPLATEEFWRLRTASEGAIPAPAQRPQSGAFSESDVEPPGGAVGISALLGLDRVLSGAGRWRLRDPEAKETAI